MQYRFEFLIFDFLLTWNNWKSSINQSQPFEVKKKKKPADRKCVDGCRNLEDSLLPQLAAKSDREEEEGRGKLHSDVSIPSHS